VARTLATNYTGTLQFPYATAGTDLFKKEDVQTLALAVDQHDHSSGKGLFIPAASVVQPFLDLTVSRNTYHGTTTNIIRPTPGNTTILSIEATAAGGFAVISGRQGSIQALNVTHNGTTWAVIDSAAPSAYSGWDGDDVWRWRGAPSGSTAYVEMGSVSGSTGNASFRGGVTVNTGRGPNAGGISMQTQAGAGSDVQLFSENGQSYFWFASASGALNIQQSGGTVWRSINCGPLQVGGTGNGISVTDGQILAGYNVGGGFACRNSAGTGRLCLWVDAGDQTVLSAGAGGQLRIVNSANSVQYCHWDANGYNQDAGFIRTSTGSSASGLYYGTLAISWCDGASNLIWHGGQYYFRNLAGSVDLLTVASTGNTIVRGTLTVNAARGANQGNITFYGSAGGDYAIFSESGNLYVWGPNGVYVQGSGGSGWKPISASAFNVNSAAAGKSAIAPITDPMLIVTNDALHGVTYNDVTGEAPVSAIGFVADAWAPIVPEVVAYDHEGNLSGMDYAKVGAITFEALKNFAVATQARLDALEAATRPA